MNREYIIHLYYNHEGRLATSSERRAFNDQKSMKEALVKEYTEENKDDPTFIRAKVISLPSDNIDYELSERMSAIRDICELGHKVRAATKIRNRQPLRNAYISFTDRDMQDYMLYVDCGKNDFADTIKDELNVLDVQFIDEAVERTLFDYNLKPNFRSLGPKGYGKQAQAVKVSIQNMSANDRNDLYHRLKSGEIVAVLDVPLTLSDVEVEFNAKAGFMAANDKVGAIILDTTLDDSLLEAGFIADFRSAIQNIRKEASLNITDKVFIEVFCSGGRSNSLQKHKHRLTKELLATDIRFFPPNDNGADLHRFVFHRGALKTPDQVSDIGELDNESLMVRLYREGI